MKVLQYHVQRRCSNLRLLQTLVLFVSSLMVLVYLVLLHSYRGIKDIASGVFIRLPEKPGDPWAAVNSGYEVQIDNGTRHVGGDFHCTGVLYSLTKAMAHPQKAPGEWNTMEITLKYQRTIVHVNGEKVTDYTEGDQVPPKIRDFEPDRGPRPSSGYIGLQTHDPESIVFFKEVAVKSIKQ